MRVTTLKAGDAGPGALVGYYAGLAADQLHRDGRSRGPVDYYLDPNEPPGRWWGEGCSAMGVGGQVHPEQLALLLDGRHPADGHRLARAFGRKSARGFDATFSAPKSASALWALTDDPWVRAEVLAAQDAAVDAGLEWFERHGAVTRRGRDGLYQVDTRGLVVALFRQHTSRSADPQLHTHAVIAAKVQDPTGKWLSLDARFLKRQQRSISWVYAAALRAELTGRLGVSWGPTSEGHAELAGVPEDARKLFSERTEQVEAKTAELVAAWIVENDGAEPDARTIYKLERVAALVSRPSKHGAVDAEALRAEWLDRARQAGLGPLAIPDGQRPLPGTSPIDVEDVVTRAVETVSATTSTWLRADLAREIAAILPAEASSSAAEAVGLIDRLADAAANRCVELHRPPAVHAKRRRDGRPVTEHVVDRRVTTQAVLVQERRLIDWAAGAVAPAVAAAADEDAVRAVAGAQPLVLLVGPAGAGKTTLIREASAALSRSGRAAIGLAPSGKATDVLAQETGLSSTTLAKLLHDHRRPAGAAARISPPAGATVVLDEAGMASTNDLDALIALVQRRRWRLVCVGDPAQLPAVGRGGMFAHWCETLPHHRLEEVRRFADAWQARASLGLRRGHRASVVEYARRGCLQNVHPSLLADRVARAFDALAADGRTVAVTVASSGTARRINVEIQRRRHPRQDGLFVLLRDGTKAFKGDQVVSRRNDVGLITSQGVLVRNRQSWAVADVMSDGSVVVIHPERGSVRLPAAYVARHLELGWAVTGYGNQGVTTDHGICVVEPSSTRAGVYVAMTRGRGRNIAFVVDPTGAADTEEVLAGVVARPESGITAHAVAAQLGGGVSADVGVDNRVERMRQRLDQLAAAHGPPGRTRP